MATVQIDSPVMAFTANRVEPEWRYITPSTTTGVTDEMLVPESTSNNHARARRPTFEVLISSRAE